MGHWYWMTDLKGRSTREFLSPSGVVAAVRLGYSLERIRDGIYKHAA